MNKSIMVIWFLLVFLLLGFIVFLGYKKRDNVYLELESSLEKVTKRYVINKNDNIKFNDRVLVFVDELIENNYLDEDNKELIDKYCVKSIVFTKGLFIDNYKINKECENKE